MRIRPLQRLIPNIHENPLYPAPHSFLAKPIKARNLLFPKRVVHGKQIPIPPFPKRLPLLVRHGRDESFDEVAFAYLGRFGGAVGDSEEVAVRVARGGCTVDYGELWDWGEAGYEEVHLGGG